MVTNKIFCIKPNETAKGKRIDVFLATALPNLSRSRIQSLLLNGHITEQEKTFDPAYKIKGNETLIVNLPDPKPSHLEAQDLPLSILYEDTDIIVINKPAGMVVHPGAGNNKNTLVNALLFRFPGFNVGDVQRPGLVHRLDKETSGVMVCARNNEAHLFLSKSFKSREVQKTYRAFCFGNFKEHKFELKTGHKRHPIHRKRFTTKLKPPSKDLDPTNRLAHSQFEVLQTKPGISELKVKLLTGRTHQIRAHLADIGHPLVKDALYGGLKISNKIVDLPILNAIKSLNRHALHAESLSFTHPKTHKPVTFTAPLPEDLLTLHKNLLNNMTTNK